MSAMRLAKLFPYREQGTRLELLRVNARLTQEQLAHGMGYLGEKAAANVSRFESGERAIPLSKREAAALHLAASPFLVDDWYYILSYMTEAHSDLRGCIAAVPRLSLVRDDEANNKTALDQAESGNRPFLAESEAA